MATVRKCDICGEIHDLYPTGNDALADIGVIKRNDKFSSVYGKNEIDCCPECTAKLLSFIDILQTYPTRYIIEITSEEV